ncbi:serine hydrolase domain-containing protein [Gemmatimonas sp.]|uniref:serine hydrolase domain-containing protein n=1 Tax=Gemmatimonas sp. TaxID=1962908 RepID=UPI00391FC680
MPHRPLAPLTRLLQATGVAAVTLMTLPMLPHAAYAQGARPARSAATQRLIARADSLQLPGAWTPPPGDGLAHHIAGFATTMCAAVFLTGLDPADAAANVGFFSGPVEYRRQVIDTVVDRARREIRLTLPGGVVRAAKVYGSQGCVTRSIGEDSVRFTPQVVTPNLPPAASTPWPMGDVLPTTPWPAGVDSALVARAVNEIFGPAEAMTLGVVITHKGRIIGERYAPGIGIHTPLESWSMGKSLTGTLVGRLIQMGVYRLDQPAPIPEWQQPGDPRQAIRIQDILRMSSGLRIRAPQDPDYEASLGYPDHLYYYTGPNAYQWAATRPPQWAPNTVGRYRNTDPILASYLVKLGAAKLGQDYFSFPQRTLFDKLGMRDVVIWADPARNLLGTGGEVIAARDWARLGMLHLQDGVWNGERLLPEGFVREHVRTLAPAWVADGRPQYGGAFFWINGDGREPMPREAFAMLGAGGQSAWMIPSHDLVIVRIGKYRGSSAGEAARRKGTVTLLQALRGAGGR